MTPDPPSGSRWADLARHTLLKRTLLFSGSIGLSTLVAVFSIPILVSRLGAEQWGLLAVLQSVCMFFAVAVAFGWGATGPSLVASLPGAARRQFLWESVIARGLLFLIALPLAVLTGWLVTGEPAATAALAAFAYVLPGLSSAWYFIGANRPVALFLLDSLPATLGQIAGLVAVAVDPRIESYLWAVVAFSLAGAAVSWWFTLVRGAGPLRLVVPWRGLLRAYRDQLSGFTASITGSFYSTVPTVAVQVFAPQALPMFVIIDRLNKYAVLVLAPVLQSIQSWIPEAGPAAARTRSGQALWLSLGIGVLGFIGFAVLSAPVSSLLTHGEIVIPVGLGLLMGLAFIGEAVGQIGGLACLVALGGGRYLAASSLAAAIVGSLLILMAVPNWGAAGAVAAIAVTSIGLAVYRTVIARRLAARPAAV